MIKNLTKLQITDLEKKQQKMDEYIRSEWLLWNLMRHNFLELI